MISHGIDLVEISRFQKLIHDEHFLHKYFTEKEQAYIESRGNNLATIAGIYASKEAFLKAIRKRMNVYPILDIEVLHDEENAPYIVLHHQIKKDISFQEISLSISHDGEYAIASIVILF